MYAIAHACWYSHICVFRVKQIGLCQTNQILLMHLFTALVLLCCRIRIIMLNLFVLWARANTIYSYSSSAIYYDGCGYIKHLLVISILISILYRATHKLNKLTIARIDIIDRNHIYNIYTMVLIYIPTSRVVRVNIELLYTWLNLKLLLWCQQFFS